MIEKVTMLKEKKEVERRSSKENPENPRSYMKKKKDIERKSSKGDVANQGFRLRYRFKDIEGRYRK